MSRPCAYLRRPFLAAFRVFVARAFLTVRAGFALRAAGRFADVLAAALGREDGDCPRRRLDAVVAARR